MPKKVKEEKINDVDVIRKKMNHFSLKSKTKYWLDTGIPRLHKAFGSKKRGLAFGKIYEIFGEESNGKTALAMDIMGMAQKAGAKAAIVDLEYSWDDEWAMNRGIYVKRNSEGDLVIPALFQPYVGQFGSNRAKPELISAEALLDEVETWMYIKSRKYDKLFVLVDSVAAMLAEKEADGGLTNQNMSTRAGGLPQMMSQMLRRWVGLAGSYNAMIIFINQTRQSPGIMFGNPNKTTGGKALKFYASIRVQVNRKSRMRQGKEIVGIKGFIKNIKNKAGGGSTEGYECGYKIPFTGKPSKFPSFDDMKEELKNKREESE